MTTRYRFNLLKKKSKNLETEIVGFFNKYIRYILVITQLIVLSVFFSKILLDQKIVDLKESIDQKKQIITSARPMISANNRLATQISLLETLVKEQRSSNSLIVTVLENVPESIKISSFSFDKGALSLQATTFRPVDIKKFEVRLSKKFPGAQVLLDRITIDSQKYTFSILISYGEKT